MHLGKHIIVDMFDCNIEKCNFIIENKEVWESFINDCFEKANITLLETSWHNFDKKGAFTVLYLLAESHLSIHTWPEHKYIALDVFTCGNSNTSFVVDKMIDYFEPQYINKDIMKRGGLEKKQLNINENSKNKDNNHNECISDC